MKKITIISSVVDGNLKRNRNLIKAAIATFENKNVDITIQLHRKIRSNQQNRFYYGVVLPLVQEGLKETCGEVRSIESIHYNIILPLCSIDREIVNTETGLIINEKMTSSEMSTTEFMEYVMNIQKWSAEFLGINIPDPNSEIELKF